MKKWMFLYVLIGTAFFLVFARYQSDRIQNTAETLKDSSYWLINETGGSYLLLGGEEEEQWKAVRVDGKKKNYQLLGAVNLDMVYCQYRYQDEKGNWVYGTAGYRQDGSLVWSGIEQPEQNRCLAFGGREDHLYYVKAEAGGALVREYCLSVRQEGAEWQEIQSIEAPEGHQVVGASYEDGMLQICLEDGTVYRYESGKAVQRKEGSEQIYAKKNQTLPETARKAFQKAVFSREIRKYLLPYLLLFFLFGLVLFGILRHGSPIRRIFCMAVVVLAAVVLAGGGLAGIRIWQELKKEALTDARYTMNHTWEKADKSGKIARTDLLLAVEQSNRALSDLLLLDMKAIPAEVVSALWLPEGLPASSFYGEDLERLIARSRQVTRPLVGEINQEGYANPVLFVQTLGEESLANQEQSYVLVGILSGKELSIGFLERVRTLVWIMGILFAGGLVMLSLGFVLWGTAWNRFSKAVMAVAKEKEGYQLPEKAPLGLQGLWKSLEEINRSMGELHYEKYQSLKAYSRFVPRKIETILGKKGLGEVEVGDMAEVSGYLALLSLRSFQEPGGRQYMELVTRSFAWMNRVLEEKRGILVSQDADLAKRKLLFLERPEAAVEFGIEVIQAYDREPLLRHTEKLVLLHSSKFLYGISGTPEQAVPFLYSKEEAFLVPYIEPLCRAGLRLVLTEDLVEKLKGSYSMRYIGFVKKGDTEESIKLYEGLDAFPEAKKKLWLETEPEFRQALELFYSNDFYLARNTFNEVVKKNPEDRIARWYLFNCEYHLNTTGDSEILYGLFENRMLEQQYRTM